jgi:hypothetical protein
VTVVVHALAGGRANEGECQHGGEKSQGKRLRVSHRDLLATILSTIFPITLDRESG